MKKIIKKIIFNKFLVKIIGSLFLLFKKFSLEYIYSNYRKKYDIAKNFIFNGESIHFYGEGKLIIKDNSYIGSYSTIQVTQGAKVYIGKNVFISHNVRIYTSNRNPEDIIYQKKEIRIKKGNVIIKDNCWIGANVFICHGVTIGENCVIGANSVVSKDIPNNSIAAGAPIKIFKNQKLNY